MTVVVSDTSPIRCLVHLQHLTLLKHLYHSVLIPPAVFAELKMPPWVDCGNQVTAAGFVTVRAPRDARMIERFRKTLDAGEAEALALAIEAIVTDVLIDEKAGRAAALSVGLRPLGVLGVLLQAKTRGFIPDVTPLIQRLKESGRFFLSDTLVNQIRRQAGELK